MQKEYISYNLELLSLNPFYYRRSGTGATDVLVQYSINGGTFTDITTINLPSSSNSGALASAVDLSGVSALQNIQSISTVTFRFVPYGATASAGAFYIYDVNNTTANDFAFNGNLSSCTSTSATPVVNPICTGGTTVTGTSSEANGTLINVYLNGNYTVPATTATVTSGVWSATTASTLTAGTTVTAYATASGKCVSSVSSTVTVAGTPDAAAAGVDQNICDGGAATLAANNPTVGTGSWSVVAGSVSTNTSQFASLSTYNTTFTPDGGAGTYTLVWTISSSPCTASTDTVVINVKTTGQWVGPNTGGDWLTGTNWCGGVPSSSSSVTIPSGVTINVSTGNISIKDIIIDAGGSLVMTGAHNITISSGGTITNNGTFDATGSTTGAVVFAGTGSVTGTITFENVTISNGVDFGTASTIDDGGTLTINTGGYINNSHPPIYHCNSTLKYNVNATYGRFNEWTTATSGAGYPGNVLVTNNSILNLPNGSGSARAMCGNLTIDAGSAVYMDYSGGSLELTIGGDIEINGNLSLGSSAGGDIKLGGDWTQAASGASIDFKGRAIFFNGSGDQVLTKTGGGTLNFNGSGTNAFLIIDKTSGNVKLASNTDVTFGQTSGNAITFTSGGLDLNGRTFTLTGNGSNILVSGGVRTITSSTASTFAITGTKTVTSSGGGTLVLDNNVTTDVTASFNPGSSLTTVNGTLKLSSGGSLSTNTVTYGSASTLVYNQTGTPTFGNEWTGNGTTAGSGIPQNVTIQNSTTVSMPAADRGLAGDLNISSGTLALNGTFGNDLFVGGSWTRTSSGTFTPNDRAVFFNGATAATITAPNSGTKDSNGSFGGETFPYIIINKAAKANTVSLGSNMCVTKTLTLTKGTLELAAGDIVLASNATTTADIAPVDVADADISYSSTGRFIPQRFIGNTSTIRTWRFLTAPFQSTETVTINQAWQGGQVSLDPLDPGATNPYPGFSTHITQPNGTYNPANGFDKGVAGTNGYSIEYFDNSGPTTKLGYPANTNATPLMSQLGWGLFVRGDRGFVLGGPTVPSGNTTLEPKGKINIGTVTSNIVAGRTNVVGNPYPCQVNMANVEIGGFIHQDFKLWDPKAFTNYSKTGKYIFFTWDGISGYDVTNGPTTTWASPGTIESSEAFLTYNSVPGSTVVFHETDKVSGTSSMNGIQSRPVAGSRPNAVPFARLQTDLQFYNSTLNTYSNVSGANAYFNNTFNSAVVLGEDNVSPVGSALGEIRILKDGYQLSTDREPVITSDDTVFFHISKANQGKHRLVISTKYFVPDAVATLEDKYLNTSTQVAISNTDSTFYEFDITADVLSNSSDRFMLVLRPSTSGPLPVKFSSIKAAQQSGAVSVEWKVENEVNVNAYEIEKSTDGVHFTKVSTTIADGRMAYSWLDAASNTGNTYYRIRMVDKTGVVSFSQIVLIKSGSGASEIGVYPNPVTGGVVGLQMTNMPKGKYGIRILNTIGQTIFKKTIQHLGGNSTETLSLGKNIINGLYKLEVIGPDNKITVIDLLK